MRATVRDTDKDEGHDPLSVKVTLAQYTKKGGDLVLDKAQVLTPIVDQTMILDKTKKNEKTYYFKVTKEALKANIAAKALIDGDLGLVSGTRPISASRPWPSPCSWDNPEGPGKEPGHEEG